MNYINYSESVEMGVGFCGNKRPWEGVISAFNCKYWRKSHET